MTTADKQTLLTEIDMVLNEVRGHLAIDGGNIEVTDVTDDMIVKIRWLGNCESCTMTTMTMRAGIEYTLKNKMPHIKGVMAINGVNANQ